MENAQVEKWRNDVVAFAEEALHIRSPETGKVGPLRLADHQRDFLREATRRGADGGFVHRTCVASWPRREGKTTAGAILAAWRLACHQHQRILILANSREQASSNSFAELTDFFVQSPALRALVIDRGHGRGEDDLQKASIFVRALDNQVEVLPCRWQTLQGRPRCDLLLVDEAHASEDPRAITFAQNQLEARDAQCVISSTAGPNVNSNVVWRLYQARSEPHVHFSYMTEHRMPWAIALAKRERVTLLPSEWDYQHRNRFGLVAGERLFPAAAVEDAATDEFRCPTSPEEWERVKERLGWGRPLLGAGLDRAGVGERGDQSVVVAVAQHQPGTGEAEYVVTACDILPTGAEGEVLGSFQRINDIFGYPHAVLLEYYGAGDLVPKIAGAQPVHPTVMRKRSAFTRLHRAFTERKIIFPSDAGTHPKTGATGVLKEQLLRFTYELTPTGARFGTQGGTASDDCVDALCWAVDSLGSGASGQFALAIHDYLGEEFQRELAAEPKSVWDTIR